MTDRGCPSGIVRSSFADARVSRERGSLGAGRSPASLEASAALRILYAMDIVRV